MTLVGNRNGHAVIHWPGVFGTSLIIIAVVVATNVVFAWAIGWFELKAFQSLLFSIPMSLACAVGMNVKRGLRKPVHQLPTLG